MLVIVSLETRGTACHAELRRKHPCQEAERNEGRAKVGDFICISMKKSPQGRVYIQFKNG